MTYVQETVTLDTLQWDDLKISSPNQVIITSMCISIENWLILLLLNSSWMFKYSYGNSILETGRIPASPLSPNLVYWEAAAEEYCVRYWMNHYTQSAQISYILKPLIQEPSNKKSSVKHVCQVFVLSKEMVLILEHE